VNIAIVGAGKIGEKRAKACKELGLDITTVVDIDFEKAYNLSISYNIPFICKNYEEMFSQDPIDMVIVSTTNNMLYPVSKLAIEHGKHVLVEKPGGMNSKQLFDLMQLSRQNKIYIRVGYNHRFHPSVIKMLDIVYAYGIGDIMYIKGEYGHGGKRFESGWRTDKSLCGFGDFGEKGIHLIDLSQYLISDLKYHCGSIDCLYKKDDLDDNSFVILKNNNKQVAFLHSSTTEWNAIFKFSVHGTHGNLIIEGLNGIYGKEVLTFNKQIKNSPVPDVIKFEYLDRDYSWLTEIKHFIQFINNKHVSNIEDAYNNMKIVEEAYRDNGINYEI